MIEQWEWPWGTKSNWCFYQAEGVEEWIAKFCEAGCPRKAKPDKMRGYPDKSW